MLKPLKKYLTIPQMLHLQLGSNHVLIYSLNFVIDVNDFIFVGSLFHILGPTFIAISCSIIISDYDIMWSYFGRIFVFGVTIFFIYEGFILFIVLKISFAKVRNLFISAVVVTFFLIKFP